MNIPSLCTLLYRESEASWLRDFIFSYYLLSVILNAKKFDLVIDDIFMDLLDFAMSCELSTYYYWDRSGIKRALSVLILVFNHCNCEDYSVMSSFLSFFVKYFFRKYF